MTMQQETRTPFEAIGGEERVRALVERFYDLACMDQAMSDVGVDAALRQRLGAALFQTADWMRNTPD